jgi:hypothetical protein
MSISSVVWLRELACPCRHIPAFLIHGYVFYVVVVCILTLGRAAVLPPTVTRYVLIPSLRQSLQMSFHPFFPASRVSVLLQTLWYDE